MLANKKMTIESETILEEVKIARYIAVLDIATCEVNFYHKQIDTAACKANREIVRADQAEFEDFVYSVQDKLLVKGDEE